MTTQTALVELAGLEVTGEVTDEVTGLVETEVLVTDDALVEVETAEVGTLLVADEDFVLVTVIAPDVQGPKAA